MTVVDAARSGAYARGKARSGPAVLPALMRVLRSPLFWIGACIFAAHAPYLLGFFDPNPILIHSNLGLALRGHLTGGTDTVDPNDGFTSQALAHRAMVDWLHGNIPWWNQYEGVGIPLAGEMQSASFFPFALFVLFSNGQELMYFVLCLIAGYSTFFLLRRLGFSPWIAAVGAVCFGLNGTFAWLRFAPANPVCFLPLMLLGIEIARERAVSGGRTHWWVIAVALALSLVAGFPETAYLDGLLAVVWTLARSAQLPRPQVLRFLRAVGAGAVGGLLLAAPFLAAVAGYLPYASLGPNANTATAVLHTRTAPTLFFPYIYGPIWSHLNGKFGALSGDVWANVGGYLTVALVLLAVFGLFGRSHRILKLTLTLWSLVMVAVAFGLPVITPIVDVIPGIKHVVVARYMNPTLSLAVLVLAAFGIRNLLDARVRARELVLVIAAVSAVGLIMAIDAYQIYHKISPSGGHYTSTVVWGLVTVVVIALAALTLRALAAGDGTRPLRAGARKVAALLLIAVLPIEAITMFIVPEFSAPTSGKIDFGVVRYLGDHLGYDRFATLGPLLPNYGSYFGLAAINENDLPLPSHFRTLVLHDLAPSANPVTFTGTVRLHRRGLFPVQAFVRYFRNYEALGVKYVLVSRALHKHDRLAGARRRQDRHVERALRGLGMREVYTSPLAHIYELPDPTPYFSTTTGGCAVQTLSWSQVRTDCSHPATLLRNELYMPGWSASVNGSSAKISSTKLYQQLVSVPAGRSTVTFNYRPRFATEAWLAALIGICACCFSAGLRRRHFKLPARRSSLAGSGTGPDPGAGLGPASAGLTP